MTQSITWQLLPYNRLTTDTLYDILQLRAEVFVVEQNCPYQDLGLMVKMRPGIRDKSD